MPSLQQTYPPTHPAVHNPVMQSPAMQQGQYASTKTYVDYGTHITYSILNHALKIISTATTMPLMHT
jgi:hypothetical protein